MKKTILIGIAGLVLVAAACGTNLFNSFADKKNENARLEEARVQIDQGDYVKAREILDELANDGQDSNERRILLAGVLLGENGFDLWNILIDLVQDTTSKDKASSSGSGISKIFDLLTESVFGAGATRAARIAALDSAVTELRSAPDPQATRVSNLACLLAGIMAVPIAQDGLAEMQSTLTTLEKIKTEISSGGQCHGVSELSTRIASFQEVLARFNHILESTANCGFINLDEQKAQLNAVESKIKKLTNTADKGCSTLPTCPAAMPDCLTLFPVCVQEALRIGGTNPAVSGDGIIDSCEVILHCTHPADCFGP